MEEKLQANRQSITETREHLKLLEQEKHAIELSLSLYRRTNVVKQIAHDRSVAAGERPEVLKVEDVAVLFADIVGFTEICRQLEATQSIDKVRRSDTT